MHRSSGRYVGRVWTGRWCEQGCGGSKILLRASPYVTSQRFASSLDLPSLDRKWRQRWSDGPLGKDERAAASSRIQPEDGTEQHAEQQTNSTRQKKYVLAMFPYPSGDLHLGHLRVYTISDVLSRFQRMQGHDVMHPIGWDAFGLPAENAAIERGIDPAVWTKQNIEKMKSQLKAMNGHWDWDREFATCDPTFYNHTQRLFLLLHERGLAYQAESLVNYDPVDMTVLANEQVDANGHSWRSGAKVEKRMLKQWFLKISEFRQELLDDLDLLSKDGAWPEKVIAMQKNWLGKSSGAKIKFNILSYDGRSNSSIEVFTTRPDTLFGVQYLALASTHPTVLKMAKQDSKLKDFLDTLPSLPLDSKAGYILPSIRGINPMAYEESTPDATKASLPIFVAPYVLGDYGDGAVMGVPGHDARDNAFWKVNKPDEPVRMVVEPTKEKTQNNPENGAFVHKGQLIANSGRYAGMSSEQASKEIIRVLESNDLGSTSENWRLRDWLVSRQRYWGTPIPIIHCGSCGPVPVPEEDLPVELPNVQSHWANTKTGNPLEHAHHWLNTSCPSCGGDAKRDTDTMDTFVDSSWYYMRFADPTNNDSPFSPASANSSLPVDLYIGGVEHAILHLLYARFISKFVATTELWPQGRTHKLRGEPFQQVLTQGMVHGKTFSDPSTGRFLKPNEVDLSDPAKPVLVATGTTPNVSYEKMSKSKYNGVDPGTCMAKYGADATRAHILFQAPVSDVLEWDEEKISGITRWLRRLHDFVSEVENKYLDKDATTKQTPMALFFEWATNVQFLSEGRYVITTHPGDGSQRINVIPQLTEESGDTMRELEAHKLDPSNVHDLEAMQLSKLMAEHLETDKKLWRTVQATIASTTDSYNKTYSLNTIVSDLMSLTNSIIDHVTANPLENLAQGRKQLIHEAAVTLLKLMAPITPAFSEECWELLHQKPPLPSPKKKPVLKWATDTFTYRATASPGGITTRHPWQDWSPPQPNNSAYPGSIFNEPFPTLDGTYELLAPSTRKCAVQVNGKVRFVVEIPVPSAELKGKDLEKWITDEILGNSGSPNNTLDSSEKEAASLGGGQGKVSGRETETETEAAKRMRSLKASGVDLRTARKVIVVQGGKTVNFVM